MWHIAGLRWWRAKRLLNDAQDNHAVLRMGVSENGRDLICHKQTASEKVENYKRNGQSECKTKIGMG